MNAGAEVPEWVRIACRHWGSQKRRVWYGGEWFTNRLGTRSHHVDGYAESFLGRLRDERVAAGQPGKRYQHFPEVLWGDGLEVQRVLIGMSERAFQALHLHYVWDPELGFSAREKAALLHMTVRVYWEAVGLGEFWIFARLAPEASEPDPLVCAFDTAQLKRV